MANFLKCPVRVSYQESTSLLNDKIILYIDSNRELESRNELDGMDLLSYKRTHPT